MMMNLFQQMKIRLEIDESDPMDFEEGSAFFEEYFCGQTDSEKEMNSDYQSTVPDVLESHRNRKSDIVTLGSRSASSDDENKLGRFFDL